MSQNQQEFTSLAGYNVLDAALAKFTSVIAFWIVIQALSTAQVGIIGIVTGILAYYTVLAVSPENKLLRDFETMKKDLNSHLSAILWFWGIRSLALITLSIIISLLSSQTYENETFVLYLIGSTIVMAFVQLQEIFRIVLFVSHRQKEFFFVNAFFGILTVVLCGLLLFIPKLEYYLAILLVVAILSAVFYGYKIFRDFNFSWKKQDHFSIIKKNLKEFSGWNHLSGTITATIYKADVLLLGILTTLTITGEYTIGLYLASFLIIIPIVLQKPMGVMLTRFKENKSQNTILNLFLKYNLLLSLGQLIIFLFLMPFLVQLFAPESSSQISIYLPWLAIATTLLNLVRPLFALAVYKTNQKELFLQVFFPSLLLSIIIYTAGIVWDQARGLAVANVIVYGLMASLLIIFTKTKKNWKIEANTWFTITSTEKSFWKNIIHHFWKH